jgi:hypothetical protein
MQQINVCRNIMFRHSPMATCTIDDRISSSACYWNYKLHLGMSIDLDQIDPDVESAIAPSVQRTSAAPETANQ